MSFLVFLKKEFKEIFKTSKIIVLPVIFLFFGIISPLSAKYTNQILAMVGEQQGIKIQLPEPTFIQSYEQLFKNLYFMVIIILILVFAGSIVEEKTRGTSEIVLTKCLSRTSFVLGKLFAAIALFTFSFIISAAACMYYTYLLFPEFINSGTWVALLSFWVFGVCTISVTLLASIIAKSFTISAVLGFVVYALFSALAVIPKFGEFTPGILQTLSTELVRGLKTPSDALIPIAVTIALSVIGIVSGLAIFRKQEL